MELLKKLTDAYGMPGWEGEIRAVIEEELSGIADVISVDRLGNLIAVKNPDSKGKHVVLSSHMDEPGLMVKSIDSGGFIRFMSWDLDKRMLPAKLVRVGEKKTIGHHWHQAVHTLKPDEKQSYLETTQLYIDIGANSKEEAAKLVSVGEYVGLEVEFAPFGEEKVVGRALESRVGCAAILHALQSEECTAGKKITAVFCAQKLTGMRGSTVVANDLRADIVINVDGVCCEDNDARPGAISAGRGPAIVRKDLSAIYPKAYSEAAQNVAIQKKIPWQMLVGSSEKSDSGSFQTGGIGIPVVGISVPIKYARTPAAMLEMSDYKNTVNLLKEYLAQM